MYIVFADSYFYTVVVVVYLQRNNSLAEHYWWFILFSEPYVLFIADAGLFQFFFRL